MKRLQYKLLVIGIFGLSACKKDFLDVPDKTFLLRQAYVTDLKTCGDYLNGVYFEFTTNLYTGVTHIYNDVVADNIKPVGSAFSPHYSWSQQADNEGTGSLSVYGQNGNGLWFSAYRIIRNSSFIIETVDKYRSENTAKADGYKGQAYALRAFAHFMLVCNFAQNYGFTADASHPGVPYIKTSDWTAAVSKQTVAEVYNNLILDLQTAIELLPATFTDTRYFNRAAVKALLARAYLFKSDFQSAKNMACEIANAYPAMTITNGYPNSIFKLMPATQTESLFQLVPTWTGLNGGTYQTLFAGVWFDAPLFEFAATGDVATLLQEDVNDVRSAWVTYDNGAATWKIKKYPTNVVPGFPFGTLSYYETIIRSSEMYLTAAESYAKISNEDSARFYLNAIRLRANPTITPVTATGAALLDSIYKERRKEFAFEGLRMYDLQRWKKGVERVDASIPSAKSLPYPDNKAISPIPLSEIELAGLEQTPGYQ